MVSGTRFDHNCETQSSEKKPLKRSTVDLRYMIRTDSNRIRNTFHGEDFEKLVKQ